MENNIIVRMDNISKSFAGIKALKNVRFELFPGEVHALLGANGAGKSTLMKILYGIVQKDEGSIFIMTGKELKEVDIRSPLNAQRLGISMVFQEFNLLNNMTVAENIFLGREPVNRITKTLNKKELYRLAGIEIAKVGLNIDPGMMMNRLSAGQKQCIEICKALSFGAQVIIFDEPTSSLSGSESEFLFNIIRDLKSKGVTIIYISHKMEEIFALSDRITVFRDGMYIQTLKTKETNTNELIKLMIGREINNSFRSNRSFDNEDVIFAVQNVKAMPHSKPLNFSLHKGEVLGFFGLVGAGRTELARKIFGIDKSEGTIFVKGTAAAINSPIDAIKTGLGLVPEDRKEYGLILGMSVKDNILISKLTQMKSAVLDKKYLNGITSSYIDKLNIVLGNETQAVKELSGGNQQKVLVARWLMTNPEILFLDEPTRGIDVGTKSEIHRLISTLAGEGKCIVMVSSELPEIMGMSDRIMVMHQGKVTGIVDNSKDLTQEELMAYATDTVAEYKKLKGVK